MIEQRSFHPHEELLKEEMKRSQSGDSEAYRRLLQVVRKMVHAYSGKMLSRMGIQDPQSTEDLVQEILIGLHKKRNTYDPEQLFTPWLFAIARYKAIDFVRSRQKERSNVNFDTLGDVLEYEVTSELYTEEDLKTLLSELSDNQRRVLEMVKIEGLSVAEAAGKTTMTESAVKVTVHRAMKFLKARAKGDKK